MTTATESPHLTPRHRLEMAMLAEEHGVAALALSITYAATERIRPEHFTDRDRLELPLAFAAASLVASPLFASAAPVPDGISGPDVVTAAPAVADRIGAAIGLTRE